jgi:hypothetical protein
MNSNNNQNIPKTRKVVDWIKYQNIKENTKNYSALKGLKRVNTFLTRSIKYGVLAFFIGYGCYKYYKDYQETIINGIKSLEEDINNLEEKPLEYLNSHIKLSIEYGNPNLINKAEDDSGITYYREKLLKNATGLVLETCCGSFRNKDFYTDKVSNVKN